MTELIFYFAGVGIGISRGVTEAIKFIYKNHELPPEYIDTHSEYHTFTLFMWLMIFFVVFNAFMAGFQKVALYNLPIYLLIVFLGYYMPYRMSYNHARNRGIWGDFYYKYYMFDFLGKTIKIAYIGKNVGICTNLLALIYCLIKLVY